MASTFLGKYVVPSIERSSIARRPITVRGNLTVSNDELTFALERMGRTRLSLRNWWPSLAGNRTWPDGWTVSVAALSHVDMGLGCVAFSSEDRYRTIFFPEDFAATAESLNRTFRDSGKIGDVARKNDSDLASSAGWSLQHPFGPHIASHR